MLYLDTSSLVKRYVFEEGSDEVDALIAGADAIATSVVAYPELRSAVARLRRARRLTSAQHAAIRRGVDVDWAAYVLIDVTPELGHEAGELAERHALRGFDAVHLASYAALARDVGVGNVQFSSFDTRLNDAARRVTRRLARS